MVRRAVLLGHLGDVCMLTHASRSNPGAIWLYTRPEFVHFATEFGDFARVEPAQRLEREGHEVVDLHATSSRDPDYRRAMRARTGAVAATQERLTWLGLPGRELPKRTYQSQSLSAYWQQLLGLAHGFPHQAESTHVRANCLAGLSPCQTLLAFQSTTRHKSLSSRTANAVAHALLGATSHRLTIVDGPGSPARGLEDFRAVKINTPDEFVQVARDHCCLVSVDSGLRHLAGLVDVPRIVVYGPTLPWICGSGVGEIPVLPTTQCRSCGDPHSCPANDQQFACLAEHADLSERIVARWTELHTRQ